MTKSRSLDKIKKIIASIIMVILIISLFLIIQQTLKLNMGHRGSDSVKGFYQEKENSIDVLFLGASTMFCTADPLTLYEDYGITSYDFCSSAQPFELTWLFMQEALKTQHPKVIFIEPTTIVSELEVGKAENLNYGLTDMPFSLNKVKGVMDMFRNDKGTGISYLIPMLQYKDRWQELTRDDFQANYVNYYKGAYTPDTVADQPLDFGVYYSHEVSNPIPERNQEIFSRMVAFCKENDIDLVVMKSPNVGWEKGQSVEVKKLADEFQIPFINFFDFQDELQIDLQNDFRDNTHFNRYGSKKASDYLGEYLKEHYELADHRQDSGNNSWNQSLLEREHDRKNEKMSRTENLADYLSLIPYKGHTVVFNVTGDVSGMEDFVSGVADAFSLDAEELKQGASFAVKDGSCISGLVGPEDTAYHTDLGSDVLQITGYSISFNRQVYQLVDNGVTILIYDDDWKQFVDVAGFSVDDPGHAVRPVEEEK